MIMDNKHRDEDVKIEDGQLYSPHGEIYVANKNVSEQAFRNPQETFPAMVLQMI
jgi:hypothetical protein